MPLPLIPLGIATLVGAAFWRARSNSKKRGQMTPDRTIVFETALSKLKDPAKLETLAASFEGEGLHAHAEVLRKRAALRRLPTETKQARREAMRKALASKNPDAVQTVADAFRNEGTTGTADRLDEYAEGLRMHAAATAQRPQEEDEA